LFKSCQLYVLRYLAINGIFKMHTVKHLDARGV
jgi:hypothetical protein